MVRGHLKEIEMEKLLLLLLALLLPHDGDSDLRSLDPFSAIEAEAFIPDEDVIRSIGISRTYVNNPRCFHGLVNSLSPSYPLAERNGISYNETRHIERIGSMTNYSFQKPGSPVEIGKRA